jgi:hypothetical protein
MPWTSTGWLLLHLGQKKLTRMDPKGIGMLNMLVSS